MHNHLEYRERPRSATAEAGKVYEKCERKVWLAIIIESQGFVPNSMSNTAHKVRLAHYMLQICNFYNTVHSLLFSHSSFI
jgi:hypothetical protein